MSTITDRRERLLTIVSNANRTGDTETITEAIRCAPIGLLSRWDRALLALLPTAGAADVLEIEQRVADGVVTAGNFIEALRTLGWPETTIEAAVRNVSTLPAWSGWGTPDQRDSLGERKVAA